MGIRHLARERAIQLLYALEFSGPDEPYEDVERRFLNANKLHRSGWGPFAKALTRQAYERREELDSAIRPTLKNWTLERLPIVERLCLRLALCELAGFPDIPLRVTINESIELARMFGNEESPVYINAVLDALAKAFPQKDFQASADADDQEPRADPNAVWSLPESIRVEAAPPPVEPKIIAPLLIVDDTLAIAPARPYLSKKPDAPEPPDTPDAPDLSIAPIAPGVDDESDAPDAPDLSIAPIAPIAPAIPAPPPRPTPRPEGSGVPTFPALSPRPPRLAPYTRKDD